LGIYEGPFEGCTAPNAVWSADFKGHFFTRDRKRCTPQTIQDAYSRFLLRCEGLIRTDFTAARYVFTTAFAEYGMPLAVRTDNGPPFASRAPGGVSRFAVWLIRLGVRQLYRRSPRPFPGRLSDPIYPSEYEISRVRTDGSVKWAGHHFPLADVLASEPIGLERAEHGDWRLHYGPLLLGTLTSRGRFKPKRCQHS
jgi:transposase InsO family protein